MSYQIQIKGQLDKQLAAWFGDCTIAHTAQGDSMLICEGCDQAALYGTLARCRDMGLTLIAVWPFVNNSFSEVSEKNPREAISKKGESNEFNTR